MVATIDRSDQIRQLQKFIDPQIDASKNCCIVTGFKKSCMVVCTRGAGCSRCQKVVLVADGREEVDCRLLTPSGGTRLQSDARVSDRRDYEQCLCRLANQGDPIESRQFDS